MLGQPIIGKGLNCSLKLSIYAKLSVVIQKRKSMLATLGFLTAAILLLLFAYTFDGLVKKDNKELRLFGLAYSLVAVAFLMWGLLSLSNTNIAFPHSVLIGDALLFVASICSVLISTPKKWRSIVVVSGTVIAIILLYV